MENHPRDLSKASYGSFQNRSRWFGCKVEMGGWMRDPGVRDWPEITKKKPMGCFGFFRNILEILNLWSFCPSDFWVLFWILSHIFPTMHTGVLHANAQRKSLSHWGCKSQKILSLGSLRIQPLNCRCCICNKMSDPRFSFDRATLVFAIDYLEIWRENGCTYIAQKSANRLEICRGAL